MAEPSWRPASRNIPTSTARSVRSSSQSISSSAKGAACYPHPARTSSPPSQDENQDDYEDRDDHNRQNELIHTHIVPEG